MNETEVIQHKREEEIEARQPSGLKRVLNVVGLTAIWAFISAGFAGALAAAIWTLIPTELLPWGATNVNLIGYVSHCSYAPASTLILLATVGVMSIFGYKLKQGRTIGLIIFTGTTAGLLIGLLGGIDITMFIGMGAGVGIGVFLGLVVGLVRGTGA